MHELLPIHHLSAGQFAEVDQLLGQPDDVHRLEELGLRCGSIVEMVRPGIPCIIRLAGNKLCFRDSDVFGVLVRPGKSS